MPDTRAARACRHRDRLMPRDGWCEWLEHRVALELMEKTGLRDAQGRLRYCQECWEQRNMDLGREMG